MPYIHRNQRKTFARKGRVLRLSNAVKKSKRVRSDKGPEAAMKDRSP